MNNIFPCRLRSCLLAPAALMLVAGCGGEPQTPEASPAASGLTTARAGSNAVPQPSANPDSVRIVFLGDSLSAGHGLAESDAFPSLVEQQLRAKGYGVDVLNAGVSGDTSSGGLSRLEWVLRSKPHLLVVELGANDALRGQPLANTERNLREIVRRGRAAGAEVLLLGMDVPTSYGPDYAGGFASLYPRIAEEEQVPLLEGFVRAVALDPGLMMADGLHPTAEGHRRLARLLIPEIEALQFQN